MSRTLVGVVVALSLAAAQSHAQASDTIRVGSIPLHSMRIGVDSFDVDFEMQTPTGPRRQQSISVVTTSLGLRGRDSVLVVRFGSDRPNFWNIDLDRRTLATLRYEQHTEIDSVIVTRRGDCMTGWVDLQNAPRRVVDCDRHTDRFAGAPMEDHFIPLMPLKTGQTVVFATYTPVFGTAGEYAFTVAGQDTLSIGGRHFRVWRVEHRRTTDWGVVRTTFFVDMDRPRILRRHIEFPNNRRTIATLRNP